MKVPQSGNCPAPVSTFYPLRNALLICAGDEEPKWRGEQVKKAYFCTPPGALAAGLAAQAVKAHAPGFNRNRAVGGPRIAPRAGKVVGFLKAKS